MYYDGNLMSSAITDVLLYWICREKQRQLAQEKKDIKKKKAQKVERKR